MRKKLSFLSRPFCLLYFAITINIVHAQLSVLNSNLNSFNITPQSLCDVNIMNYNSSEAQVIVESQLMNANNELLITAKSNPIILKKGINNGNSLGITINSTYYSSSSQAQHIRNSHVLPSGRFNHCIIIRPLSAMEAGDDYCQEFESDLNSFLLLVAPGDKDIIETRYPVLLWNHSEPFNIMTSGEFYRIIVVEQKDGQSAEAAVTSNIPVYIKNNLTAHQIQYPFDAQELKKGSRYAWQVQRIANGVITNKSEAWEFTLKLEEIKENTYASLKKKLDGEYYTAVNNKVLFKFNEEYASGNLSGMIYTSKREPVQLKAINKTTEQLSLNFKQNGYNRFEINLNELDIRKGFHTLEVKNEKGELFLLKFYTE